MTYAMKTFFLCLAILALCQMTSAYPTMVPDGACTSQDPTGHRSSPQTVPSQYMINVNSTTYRPGEALRVTVSGAAFKGFFLQARRTRGDTDTAIGTFADPPTGTQLKRCHGVNDNSWSHSDGMVKTTVITNWNAPNGFEGDLVFRATVVQGPRATYWMGVESEPLVYNGPTMMPTTPSAASMIRPITLLLAMAVGFLCFVLLKQT